MQSDGNAAAGVLSSVFAVDVTAALGRCAGCSAIAVLGSAVTFSGGPGVVLRCRMCDGVLLRVAPHDDDLWIDLQGLSYLRLPVAV